MAYPAGVITRQVTFGPAFELEDGDTAGMQVTFKATRPGVLWMATGQPAVSRPITKLAADGVEQSISLPVTDQDGWGDGDGNTIVPGEDGHVFLYIATVIFMQDNRPLTDAQPRSKVIAIPQGDGSPLDLDKLIPLTSPGGTVVSIPDIWSEQIAQAEAAALAAAGSLVDSAEFVADTLVTGPAAGVLAAKIADGTSGKADTSALAAEAANRVAGDASTLAAIPSAVTAGIAADGTVAAAAASAVSAAATGLDLVKGRSAPTVIDSIGGLVDTNGRETWLTHDASGGPSEYARLRLGLKSIANGVAAGGFLDANGRETWLLFDASGGPTDYALSRIRAALGPQVTVSTADIAILGHSLAQGTTAGATPWTTPLTTLTAKTYRNYAVAGQYARHAGARQGGTPTLITAAGSLPADTSTVVVNMSIDLMCESAPDSIAGTLMIPGNPIPGTLARTGDGPNGIGGSAPGTFARTTAGTSIAIPAGTPFIPNLYSSRRADKLILWPARNDVGKSDSSPAQAIRTIGRIIDYMTAAHKDVILIAEPPSNTDTIGSSGRTALDSFNTAIKTAFPQYWVDGPAWMLTDAAAAAVGLTWTTQDLADIASGITPSSFRSDGIHYNTLGNQAFAQFLYLTELERGWLA